MNINVTTKITAHRSWREKYPENTLIAFEKAIAIGADRIELDVHFSKDGKLVVYHDYYLCDTNNNDVLIFDTDYTLIRSIDEKIPLLDEVFTNFGSRVDYEIELKGFTTAFLRSVLILINKYQLLYHSEFTSASRALLGTLKQLESRAKTGVFIQPYPS